MDIKCRKTSCLHNDNYTCRANKIQITFNADCNTFKADQAKKAQDFTKGMFEADLEYANSRHIKEVSLDCQNTKCLFNKDKACSANGITVLDEGQGKTTCATYIKED